MTYSNATKEYKKACFSYYFNLNLPKDEEGRVNDNVHYYLGIKEFLEKNFRDINNDDNSVYEKWEEYREEAKQQAKELLEENRL
jgi:hypothetical protein